MPSILGRHAADHINIEPGKSPGRLYVAVSAEMDGCRWTRARLIAAGCERTGRMPEQDDQISLIPVDWRWVVGDYAESLAEVMDELEGWQPNSQDVDFDLPEPGRWGSDYPRCLTLKWSRWGRAVVEISPKNPYHRMMRDYGAKDARGLGLVLPEQAEAILRRAIKETGAEGPLIAPHGRAIGAS